MDLQDDRRCGLYVIAERDLLSILRGERAIVNLPEDARLESVHYSPQHAGFMVRVHSATFEPVLDGCQFPEKGTLSLIVQPPLSLTAEPRPGLPPLLNGDFVYFDPAQLQKPVRDYDWSRAPKLGSDKDYIRCAIGAAGKPNIDGDVVDPVALAGHRAEVEATSPSWRDRPPML